MNGLIVAGLTEAFIPANALEWQWGKAGYDLWSSPNLSLERVLYICRPGKIGERSYGFYVTPEGCGRPMSVWWALKGELIAVEDAIRAGRTYFAHCAEGVPADMEKRLRAYDTAKATKITGKSSGGKKVYVYKPRRRKNGLPIEVEAILRRDWPNDVPVHIIEARVAATGRLYPRQRIYGWVNALKLKRTSVSKARSYVGHAQTVGGV